MKIITVAYLIVFFTLIIGCKTAKNGPVVSPDSISTETSSEGATELPQMIPWWVE